MTRVTRALDMSASGLSLFANFRPFFVSHYEGSEELCREIQARYHYYCKPNQCKVTAADSARVAMGCSPKAGWLALAMHLYVQYALSIRLGSGSAA